MTFQKWFQIGMKRDIPELYWYGGSARVITVGGSEVTDDRLYRPYWDALSQNLRDRPHAPSLDAPNIADSVVGTIWCNHFLEHLPGPRAVEMLREFERVLVIGGVANIVTPYYNSHLQAQDPDHKSAWNEDSWPCIFANKFYGDHGEWRLRVHTCFIAGVVERNLALFTQLVKQ